MRDFIIHNKFISGIAAAAFFLFWIAAVNIVSNYTWDSAYTGKAIGYLLLALAGAVAVTYLTVKKPMQKQNMFLVMIIPLALTMGFTMPFCTVPDESFHILHAYEVSNNILAESNVMRSTDVDYGLQFFSNYSGMTEGKYLLYLDNESKSDDVSEIPLTGDYAIESMDFGLRLSYLAPALAITLCRMAGLNGFWTMIVFGRWANFAVYVLLIYFAIKIIPFGKMQLMVISMLPMSLHLAVSYSYDPIAISCSIFLFAAAMKVLTYESWEDIKRECIGLLIACAAVMFVLFWIKQKAYVFVDLFAIICLLYRTKYRRNLIVAAKLIAKVAGILLAVYLVFGFFVWITPFSLNLDVPETYITRGTADVIKAYTVQYFLNDPYSLIYVFMNTAFTSLGSYYQQMIGARLGSLNVYTPALTMELFTIFLLLSSIQEENDPVVPKFIKKQALILGALTFAAISFIMLMQWTQEGSAVIEGVQGRYALPVLAMLLLYLRSKDHRIQLWSFENSNLQNFDTYIMCGVMVTYVYVFGSLMVRV